MILENITLEFISDRDLYQSYMPFMKNGGLFVRTTQHFDLASESGNESEEHTSELQSPD